MRTIATLLVAAAVLAGCATSEFNASGGDRRAPYEGEVEVLRQLPRAGSYELLGVVMVQGVGLTSDERMFEQLKERAADQGADAVVPQGEIRVRPTTQGGEERTLAGYAIRRR